LVPDYGEDAGLALDDAIGRLQTHLTPRLAREGRSDPRL